MPKMPKADSKSRYAVTGGGNLQVDPFTLEVCVTSVLLNRGWSQAKAREVVPKALAALSGREPDASLDPGDVETIGAVVREVGSVLLTLGSIGLLKGHVEQVH